MTDKINAAVLAVCLVTVAFTYYNKWYIRKCMKRIEAANTSINNTRAEIVRMLAIETSDADQLALLEEMWAHEQNDAGE